MPAIQANRMSPSITAYSTEVAPWLDRRNLKIDTIGLGALFEDEKWNSMRNPPRTMKRSSPTRKGKSSAAQVFQIGTIVSAGRTATNSRYREDIQRWVK